MRLTSTEQNPTYRYKKINDVTVTLTVTAANGCQSSISKPSSVITGVEEIDEAIAIYPNPLRNGPLRVEMNERGGATVKLSIFNMLGQSVYEQEFQIGAEKIAREIPAGNLADGIYVVKIKVGDRILVRKVVKGQ